MLDFMIIGLPRSGTTWAANFFCTERHRLLVDIEMQPKFSGLSVGPEVTRRLMEELQRAAGW